eukprot:CAMPEP_0117442088 /NCGR_PEP_ID=MMETSP0759-20121206/3970_1 /TAXON_ID=63605 /ORGANISM="Percolomonas cosmopolitus, Strain WS" /LENGTH=663 /DNA_ID=CAMNT_0005233963 /DNA_START=75 /DNA_END=2066 /DNA_ORIENTATION=+
MTSSVFAIDSISKTEQEFSLSEEQGVAIRDSHDSSIEIVSSPHALLQNVQLNDCFGLQVVVQLRALKQKSSLQQSSHTLTLTFMDCANSTIKITNHSAINIQPVIHVRQSKNLQIEFVGFDDKGVQFEQNDKSQKITLVWAKNEKSLRSSFEQMLPDGFVGTFNAETKELKHILPLVYVSHESLERPVPVKVTAIKTRRQPPRFASRTKTPTPIFYKMTEKTFKSLEDRLSVENGYLSDENGALIDPNQLTTGAQYFLRGDISPVRFQGPTLKKVGLLYDERMCLHKDPDEENDVEQPRRISEIWRILNEKGLADQCTRIDARKITEEEATMTHTKKYFSSFVNSTPMKRHFKFGSDIYFNEHTVDTALLGCGSVVEMTERVLKKELDSGFVIVRPPGHHAESDRAEGFCFLNNCSVAADVARRKYSLERILIVDFDVHHGNGIQHIFEDDNQILYFSTHRHSKHSDFYPGTGAAEEIGEGKGRGYNINVPFLHSYNDADILGAFFNILLPVAFEFNPQLVICAAGFDAVKDDPLGGCSVSPSTYGLMCSMLQSFAGGRMVMALEGGYNLRQTAFCVAECLQVLLGRAPCQPPASSKDPRVMSPEAADVIQRVRELHTPFWSCMNLGTRVAKNSTKPQKTTEEDLAESLTKMKIDPDAPQEEK